MSTSTEEIVEQEQSEFEKAQIEKRRQNDKTSEPEREIEGQPGERPDGPDQGEQDPDDESGLEPRKDKPTGRSLFDASLYETEPLSLPKVDGEGVDKISAKFNGHVRLDRGQEADVAIIKAASSARPSPSWSNAKSDPPSPA